MYDKAIGILRKDEWFNDFPKGSNLLTYLYNIVISLESDLSATDLARKLFQKALKPYLGFINAFIYQGTFEDPFNEFFVEKLDIQEGELEVKYQQSNNLKISEKQKFMMRNDTTTKIPIFLTNFAMQIYKCGTALSLLKEVPDSEYTAICCDQEVDIVLNTDSKFDIEAILAEDEIQKQALRKKVQRNYEKFQQKVDEEQKRINEAKREKQAQEMQLIEDQMKENEERKQVEKQKKEEEDKEVREQYDKEKQVCVIL